jgi:hypothetical protein
VDTIFSMQFSAKDVEAAPNRLHRHGFRRRFVTTVLLVSRLAGVKGGSYPSALLDEVTCIIAEAVQVGNSLVHKMSRSSLGLGGVFACWAKTTGTR